MAGEQQMYVIGLDEAPVRAFYYIEDRKGEKPLPVFTTLERLERHVRTNLASNPKSHMEMMEGNPLEVIRELTEGRNRRRYASRSSL